jgi:cytidylate kinase
VDAPRPADVPLGSMVVALDGPSGSGKSSVARGTAVRLGLRYLDTGAMYRAVTWWMLEHGVDVEDATAVAERADRPALAVGTDAAKPTIAVDGLDVSQPIRSRAVTNAVSAVSAVPEVRRRLVAEQQRIIGSGGIVVEGRDIGSVVAPDAPVKVYLTAAATARAHRRSAELTHDPDATVDRTHDEILRRDRLDSSRAASPFVKADDAHELDATYLSLDEVIGRVIALVRERAVVA